MKIGAKQYQGILMDSDNTIFDFDRCEIEAFTETLYAVNYTGPIEAAYKKFQLINQSLWADFESNKIASSAINRERFVLLIKMLKLKVLVEDLSSLYQENLSRKTYTLPYAIETLEFLSRRVLLCLITNGLPYIQRNRIARSGIEVFFHSIVIAGEIGYTKPGKEFFKIAVERLNLPQYNILCVGDNPELDIRGAHQFGIDTCWFMYRQMDYPYTEPFPDYIISDFRELKKFAPLMA